MAMGGGMAFIQALCRRPSHVQPLPRLALLAVCLFVLLSCAGANVPSATTALAFKPSSPSKPHAHRQRIAMLNAAQGRGLSESPHTIQGLDARSTRREAASSAALSLLVLLTLSGEAHAGRVADTLETSLSQIVLGKRILAPVERYIKIGQYDPARTNINYCTNVLRLRKVILDVVDKVEPQVDEVQYYAAQEAAQRLDNSFSQLDSSVYTLIFIPVDGDEPPEANKYKKQAFGFYNEVIEDLDTLISLASPEQLSSAKEIADVKEKELPAFLYKEFKEDSYRPATP